MLSLIYKNEYVTKLFKLFEYIFVIINMPFSVTDWWNGYMMNWYPFMWFMMLFWLIVLIAIAYLVYRLLSGGEGAIKPLNTAVETLNERYARGEISREDYLRMKEDIEK